MYTRRISRNQKKYSRTALGHFSIFIKKIQKPKKGVSELFPFNENSKRGGPRRKGV
jgi:hypothetical protein